MLIGKTEGEIVYQRGKKICDSHYGLLKGGKMIRKLTAFCLLIILILGISSSMAASSYTIDAPITSSVDLTASEWYSAANYRILVKPEPGTAGSLRHKIGE